MTTENSIEVEPKGRVRRTAPDDNTVEAKFEFEQVPEGSIIEIKNPFAIDGETSVTIHPPSDDETDSTS